MVKLLYIKQFVIIRKFSAIINYASWDIDVQIYKKYVDYLRYLLHQIYRLFFSYCCGITYLYYVPNTAMNNLLTLKKFLNIFKDKYLYFHVSNKQLFSVFIFKEIICRKDWSMYTYIQ